MAVMEEADRQRFLETLRSDDAFPATVRRDLLTQELLELSQTVAEMQLHLAALEASVAALIDHQAEMQGQIVELQRQMIELRGDVSTLVETTRRLLEAGVDGFGNIGREVAQHKSDTAARFDRLDAAIADLRDRLAS